MSTHSIWIVALIGLPSSSTTADPSISQVMSSIQPRNSSSHASSLGVPELEQDLAAVEQPKYGLETLRGIEQG
jgi:hypothetical protein